MTSFLSKFAEVYKPAALKDIEELKAFAGHELEPWDVAYYSEKIREDLYGYSEEELRPYFALDRVIEGAFYVAARHYGVSFKPRPDLPVWDCSVQAFEVRDRDGSELALFYLDPFPRHSKRQGAWMNSIREAGLFAGSPRRPHVVNVGNFTSPVGGEPALLTLDEVTTVFHELGHGLHGILTKARYRSLAGTNVARDFVELPSQINENWAVEPEVLNVYARHSETGQAMPQELMAKVRRAANFQTGLFGLRQVSLAMLDMAWHTADLSELETPEDVVAFEKKVMAPFRVLAPSGKDSGGLVSTNFSHIFAGGYSAGYYSYKWADVLAADAFGVFKQFGIFDPATSERFRQEILEMGGSEDPAVLYRRFKGEDPDPNALLRKEGLLP